MSKLSFEEAAEQFRAFLAERDWGKSEPKNIAVSISLEASELLEHYQWSDDPVGTSDDLAAELADIMMYCIQFADVYGIDIPTAITDKLERTAAKYPARLFSGKQPADQRAVWRHAKKSHIKKESL